MRLECLVFQKPAIDPLGHPRAQELLTYFSFPFKCSLLNRRKKAARPVQVPCARRAVCRLALMKLKDGGRALFILLDSLQRLSAPRSLIIRNGRRGSSGLAREGPASLHVAEQNEAQGQEVLASEAFL